MSPHRKPPGFQQWRLNGGILRIRAREDGTWVILVTPPDLKLDNMHDDRRPHLHVGGWNSPTRVALRRDLDADHAVETLVDHLLRQGHVKVDRLVEELS